MTDSEQFNAYTTLSEQLYTQYHHRRELEWKIHVAIWTLLSAVGYLLVTQKDKIHLHRGLLWLFAMVPVHFLWCVKIHVSEFRARHLSICYRRAAERILVEQERGQSGQPNSLIDDDQNLQPEPPRWIQDFFKSYWWWLLVEVGTTALVTTAVVFIAWHMSGTCSTR